MTPERKVFILFGLAGYGYHAFCTKVWRLLHPSIYVSMYLCICLSICLSIYLSVCLSIYLSISVLTEMSLQNLPAATQKAGWAVVYPHEALCYCFTTDTHTHTHIHCSHCMWVYKFMSVVGERCEALGVWLLYK